MSAAEEENDESFIEGSKNAYARNMRKKLLPSTLLNIVKGNIVYTPEGCWGEARTKYRVTEGFHISREEVATENAGEVVFCVSSVGNGGDGESWELQLNHFYLVENYPNEHPGKNLYFTNTGAQSEEFGIKGTKWFGHYRTLRDTSHQGLCANTFTWETPGMRKDLQYDETSRKRKGH